MAVSAERVKKFAGMKVAVLGDLIADVYISGTTSRISREAPVLIVREMGREVRLGGAANVVANVRALGGSPIPVGLVGEDQEGERLLELFAARGISREGVCSDRRHFTSTKTRVLAGGHNTVRQQMLRIDRVREGPLENDLEAELLARFRHALEGVQALLISDYGEGVVAGRVLVETLGLARELGIPVFADSRHQIAAFGRVRAVTPNEPELSQASGYDLASGDSLESAGRWMLQRISCQAVLVKRGRNGMALFMPEQPTHHVHAFGSKEVADVTGAGDTVLSAFALACLAGAGPLEAMEVANVAGGIKVTKSGTAVVEAQELERALEAQL